MKRRNSGGPRGTEHAVEHSDSRHLTSNRGTNPLGYSSAPICPQSLSGGIPTSYEHPVEEVSQLSRQRSLGAIPSTSVRKDNESHQYVQFAGGSRKQQPQSVASTTTKSSFLSRFTKRFEAETAKPLARRAMMQRTQSDRVIQDKIGITATTAES